MEENKNVLIANFMELKGASKVGGYRYLLDSYWVLPESLKYESDWNRLMSVVDKIESLGYDSRINGNNSDGGFLCDFVDIENNEMSCEVSYLSKIDAVYSAVIEFIKVYNNEKS